MDLMMTSEEICRHYRLAADKKGDIIVLADLNMTSRETIRKILEEGGEVVVRRKETSRIYGTTRGPEIEERLRKGQTVEHIARNMGMKESSVMDWIRENGKENLLVGEEKRQLTAEEEARRMEEKARRLKKEIHGERKEKVNAGEGGRVDSLDHKAKEESAEKAEEKSAEEMKEIGRGLAIRMESRGVMDRVEAVVSALPGDAEEETRAKAFSLCGAIFKEWLMKELGLAAE